MEGGVDRWIGQRGLHRYQMHRRGCSASLPEAVSQMARACIIIVRCRSHL